MTSFFTINPATFFPYFIAFLFFAFEDRFKKISWKWYVGAVVLTAALELIFPLIGLKQYLTGIIIFSEMLIIVTSYNLLSERINKILTFFLGILIGLAWAFDLMSLTGVIYNL